jgi:ubiquinone/menaquinone biosynthesis C-methylase UbiE
LDDDEVRSELVRAKAAYERRDSDTDLAGVYEPISAAPLFTVQEREWLTADLLRESGLESLNGLTVLDVGCGSGVELARLALWGADAHRMVGIDLMETRVNAARLRLPMADIRVGSAHELPFDSDTFDLVTQFTTFSSIAHRPLRTAVAAEMLRVLKPAGRILWYDVRELAAPTADLVAIDRTELNALFPGCRVLIRRSTLRWGMLRRSVPRSRLAALVLERIPSLTSHFLAVITPELRSP